MDDELGRFQDSSSSLPRMPIDDRTTLPHVSGSSFVRSNERRISSSLFASPIAAATGKLGLKLQFRVRIQNVQSMYGVQSTEYEYSIKTKNKRQNDQNDQNDQNNKNKRIEKNGQHLSC